MAFINIPNIFGPVQNFLQDFINNFQTNWGIFDSQGNSMTGIGLSLIGAVQSTYSLVYEKNTVVSDFIVQQGQFATYNKVNLPARPRVILNLTGNLSERIQFLNAIDAACKSTNLYTILTPEIGYVNFNIENYNYSRSAFQGFNLLSVELFLIEVIEVQATDTTVQTVSNPSSPSDSSVISGGKVQAQNASVQVQNASGVN